MTAETLQSPVFAALTFSVFAMTAVIWMVQLVVYPLFTSVGESKFLDYHNRYSFRISLIVIPLMVGQLVTAIAAVPLFWQHPFRLYIIAGAILTLGTWLVTFFVQVPQHAKLGNQYDKATAIKLVKGNWLRTILWTAHSVLIAIQLVKSLP